MVASARLTRCYDQYCDVAMETPDVSAIVMGFIPIKGQVDLVWGQRNCQPKARSHSIECAALLAAHY